MTLVHRRERLSGSIKYWVKPDVENRITESSIAARYETRVVRISPAAVAVEGPGGTRGAAGGRRLPPHRLPAGCRLPHARGHPGGSANRLTPEHDPQTFETNVPGLFVAGAIVSGSDGNRVFIENGRFHGAAVVKTIVARAAARA